MLKSDKISGKGDVGRRFCAGATAWLRGYDSSLAWAVGRGSGKRGAEKGENMKRKTEMARPRSFFCSGASGAGGPEATARARGKWISRCFFEGLATFGGNSESFKIFDAQWARPGGRETQEHLGLHFAFSRTSSTVP